MPENGVSALQAMLVAASLHLGQSISCAYTHSVNLSCSFCSGNRPLAEKRFGSSNRGLHSQVLT
jgi:hypothetical protein